MKIKLYDDEFKEKETIENIKLVTVAYSTNNIFIEFENGRIRKILKNEYKFYSVIK